MSSTLETLNKKLFNQLKRLEDIEQGSAHLTMEMERAKGVVAISREIVSNARLQLDAAEFRVENGLKAELPKALTHEKTSME